MLEWQQSTKETDAETDVKTLLTKINYLPELCVGSHVAVQDPHSKLWNLYGVVDIELYRRYFVKMANGHILTRNCRFLRRIALSPATNITICPTCPANPSVHPTPSSPKTAQQSYTVDLEGEEEA